MSQISRRTLLRGLGAAAVGVPVVSFLNACSKTDAGGGASSAKSVLDRGRDPGFLRVAVFSEPPYTKLRPDGTVTGAEPDVLRAVCKSLGIDDIKGVKVAYESMIPSLQAGRVDVIAAGLFMKQSRCAEVIYSEPVIVSTEVFRRALRQPRQHPHRARCPRRSQARRSPCSPVASSRASSTVQACPRDSKSSSMTT